MAPFFPQPVSDPEDPATPEFWDRRYRESRTPWDLGRVPVELTSFLESSCASSSARRRALVPGCGPGHELVAFARAGWAVTAVDFSPSAAALARSRLGALPGQVIVGDFFALPFAAGSFDLVYERTFLCAIPPALRAAWAARVREVLAPGGRVVGLFFLDDPPSAPGDGPPFALTRATLDALLPGFRCAVDRAPADSPALFAGREHWMEWLPPSA